MKIILSLLLVAGLFVSKPAQASYEPYIGEIQWFGFNFCPRGWGEANGQLLAIAQNQALFSLYGCTYGGDCRVTFGLPDLRGRAAVGEGHGPGLVNRQMGQKFGAETTTLSEQNLPSHNHNVNVSLGSTKSSGEGAVLGAFNSNLSNVKICRDKANGKCKKAKFQIKNAEFSIYDDPGTASHTLDSSAIANTGGNQPIQNAQPSLVMKACVALVGIFPSRN